jgi:hypothetical protein
MDQGSTGIHLPAKTIVSSGVKIGANKNKNSSQFNWNLIIF